MRIGEHIKQIRKTNDLSQEEFAEKLAVSRQAVSKWERGVALPDIENLMYISNLFDVSLDDLIKNNSAVSQKLIVDSAAKKWHVLSVTFYAALLLYIVYLGYTADIWLIGLAIATLFMMCIDIVILCRKRTIRSPKKHKLENQS